MGEAAEQRAALDAYGWADLGPVLGAEERAGLIGLWDEAARFRSHVVMRRHGFGEGEYKYFADPLPAPVARLREALYPGLAAVANGWAAALGEERRFPESHAAFRETCRAAGQTKPTPLLLRYGEGDYNCLHQDVYGAVSFPLQVVVLLNDPAEFEGGELVFTEQRPRMQSRAEVVSLKPGHAVAFAVNERPRAGARGVYRVKQRHGVSRLRAGRRWTLGVIFHDAP